MSKERLASLRDAMKREKLDAYIVPITDPHLGEYVPDYWRIINWLSGFSGSAANLVVTNDFAGVWTDSRYFIQAEKELDGSGFELVKLKVPHTPEYIDWLKTNLKSGSALGVDGRIFPIGTVTHLRKMLANRQVTLHLDKDLIAPMWDNRPSMPDGPVFEHQEVFTGESRESKISRLRERMKQLGVDNHLLTSLDDIAWLLNIRSSDSSYSPLFTSYGVVGLESFNLFCNQKRIPEGLLNDLLKAGISIRPYDAISKFLTHMDRNTSLLLTPSTCSVALFDAIPSELEITEEVSIPTRMKAIKNNTEIEHINNVMHKDGIALTKFFYWLEKSLGKDRITEISAADKLLLFRLEQPDCKGPSFATIAGYNEHGASPHYCSTPETDVELKKEGIFLLDSGGQYLDGTTDITRTLCLGEPTERQKEDFTLALKGTIDLAMVKFPLGTKGFQIEILARKALWDKGLNYGHGTGHGVGFFLNVHEGPQTIGTGASGDLKTILEPGMLTADEPAIYRAGEYGFRTENLILCVEDELNEYGQFLRFETITLCYIDTVLVAKGLMTDKELDWLNNYNQNVYNRLSPSLDREEAEWLKGKTMAI